MNTESLAQIAEILNSLGDKGMTAFILWVSLDAFTTLVVGVTMATIFIGLARIIAGTVLKCQRVEKGIE